MGGKQFKKEVNKERVYLSFKQKQQNMENDLKLLQDKIITSSFYNKYKIKDMINPTVDQIKNITIDNLKKAKEVGIKDPYIVFAHYLSQRFVETNVVIQNYNIFQTITETINNLTLSDEEGQLLDRMKERFEKEFDTSMKLVKYNTNSKEFQNLGEINYLGIHSNLLFNKDMHPEVFTLIIDEELLDNYIRVRGIAEIISLCPTLIAVNYILYPRNRQGNLAEDFGLDGQNYQSLFALIKGVTVNRNIKSFVLHSVEYYNINLAPEICHLIEQKLQSETLIAFHFGNFNLNQNWVKKIEFLLASTKSLLFLSYENKRYTKEEVLQLKGAIAKNRSIMIMSVVTPIFKGMKKEVLSQMKENYKSNNKDSKLELIYFSHQSLIDNNLLFKK